MAEGRWLRIVDGLRESELMLHPQHLQVFMWLLTTAKHEQRPQGKGRKVMTHQGERQLADGEITISERDLAHTLKRSKSSIHRSLEYLKKRTTIQATSGPLFTIISFVNWDRYQDPIVIGGPPNGPPPGPRPDHDRTILRDSETLRPRDSVSRTVVVHPGGFTANRAERAERRVGEDWGLVLRCQRMAQGVLGYAPPAFDGEVRDMAHLRTIRQDDTIEEVFAHFLKTRRKRETATFQNFFRFYQQHENDCVNTEEAPNVGGTESASASEKSRNGQNGHPLPHRSAGL